MVTLYYTDRFSRIDINFFTFLVLPGGWVVRHSCRVENSSVFHIIRVPLSWRGLVGSLASSRRGGWYWHRLLVGGWQGQSEPSQSPGTVLITFLQLLLLLLLHHLKAFCSFSFSSSYQHLNLNFLLSDRQWSLSITDAHTGELILHLSGIFLK